MKCDVLLTHRLMYTRPTSLTTILCLTAVESSPDVEDDNSGDEEKAAD